MNSLKSFSLLCFFLFCAVIFSSCAKKDSSNQKQVDFTVVEEADLPQELFTIINDKKETPFKLTYNCEGYLYIVQGYGMQNTGGYSILVDNIYETENAIYFDTTLKGPSKDEEVSQAMTYPYIVVKIEDKSMSVVFLS